MAFGHTVNIDKVCQQIIVSHFVLNNMITLILSIELKGFKSNNLGA